MKHKMKYITTNKLYQGKWLYRVKVINYTSPHLGYWKTKIPIVDTLFYESWVKNFTSNGEVTIRNNHPHMFMYFNDASLLKYIQPEHKWVVELSAPANAEEADLLTETKKTIRLCKKYFRGKYQYKLYLSGKTELDSRKKLFNWIRQLDNDTIFIPTSTNKWLTAVDQRWIIDTPYIYVSDHKITTTVCLFMSKNVKKIEELVLKDSINNNKEEVESVSL